MCFTNKIENKKNLDILDVALSLAIQARILLNRTQYEARRPGSFEMCTYMYNNDPKAKPPRGVVG
jgi:hypothetical protein